MRITKRFATTTTQEPTGGGGGDVDAVLRLDPALRVAREIAKQDGVPRETLEALYEGAVLGEAPPAEMLVKIRGAVKSPAAVAQVQAVIDSLPDYGSE